jgi:two-component sensor histidine kinase/CheY-like chemotaxis protein
MKKLLRVLLVEDSVDDAELLLLELGRGPWQVQARRVAGAASMSSALETDLWDIVISDYSLPGFGGMAALEILKRLKPGTPFLLVSGAVGEEAAVEALKAGADDYLMKDRLARLVPAVQRSLEEADARSARRYAEKRLRASLEEKETLLKEIHHRVKNNLQIVYSLINLQSRNMRDPKALEGLHDCGERVRAMAMVHEKLYHSDDLGSINFGEYLRDLSRSLLRSYGTRDGVSVKVEAEEMRLGIDEAVPCGLIVHELVSNCLKHAFPDGRKGLILVGLRREPGLLTLEVRDDGVGLPPDLDFQTSPSLGLRLIRLLAEQLQGSVAIGGRPGTRVAITFPQIHAGNEKEAVS